MCVYMLSLLKVVVLERTEKDRKEEMRVKTTTTIIIMKGEVDVKKRLGQNPKSLERIIRKNPSITREKTDRDLGLRNEG